MLVDGTSVLVDGTSVLVDGTTVLVDGTTVLVDGLTVLVDATASSPERLLLAGCLSSPSEPVAVSLV